MSITLTHPLPQGTPTDGFGPRAAIPGVVGAQLHTGQDWAAPRGTPVLAAHSGLVERVWWDTFANGSPAGGNMLQIGAAPYATRYAHLDGYAVKVGDQVTAGQIIGYVGRTGAATGTHLHLELLRNGVFIDPVPYLSASPTPTTPLPKRKKTMSTLYYRTDNDKPMDDPVYTGNGGIGALYALAGDSPGSPGANWIETRDLNLAMGWALVHGSAVWLSAPSFADFKTAYKSPTLTKPA